MRQDSKRQSYTKTEQETVAIANALQLESAPVIHVETPAPSFKSVNLSVVVW